MPDSQLPPISDSPLDDRAIMREVQAGNFGRFGILIHRYRTALLRLAEQRLGEASWAEDVVQESFLAAFRFRDTYKQEKPFRTWLWTICINQCRKAWAKRQRQGQMNGLQEPTSEHLCEEQFTQWEPPDARLLEEERLRTLEASLERLPPDWAEALRLRFFQGLKFQEIADRMQCSLSTAKNRVKWGLQRLSTVLEESQAAEETLSIPEKKGQ
ncbi:RNA polymerase ECF-type sigma factor [Planctomycetales bacterium 10988]|nr:RNA polymerase ECF-type sigma factor [Planctomycetales bacterium 10988]